jgi:hypothetical protein
MATNLDGKNNRRKPRHDKWSYIVPDFPGWDSLETVARYHRFAEIIGIIVLGLLVITEFVSYRYGHRKDDLTAKQQEATDKHYDEEMARLHAETEASKSETANALARAAEANERAQEAALALEKYKAPRRLTSEVKAKIAGDLRAFAGTTFIMSAVGPEPIDLAIDTADALIAAGWQWKDWYGPDITTNLPGRHRVGSVALNGTVVKIFNPAMMAAKDALVKALDAPAFEGTRDESTNLQSGTPTDVLIMIGTKR